MTQLNLAHGAAPPVGSIIGGNWSFAVANGVLKDFKWDANAFTLGGKVNGTLSINKLTNVTGETAGEPAHTIVLKGNTTNLAGNVDININGKPAFTNVPVALHLLYGKLVNLTISPAKTDNLFPFPLFGIVTSLTK